MGYLKYSKIRARTFTSSSIISKGCKSYFTFRVKNLVKLRNELFNQYNTMEELFWGNLVFLEVKFYKCLKVTKLSFCLNLDLEEALSKEGSVRYFNFMDKVKSSVSLTPHFLWNIPVKTHNNDEYCGGELSEIES